MNDLEIKYDNGFFDLDISQTDLISDNSLKNSCLISIFANARDDETQRFGYWRDALSLNDGDITGSLLWKLSQNANSQQNRLEMEDSIRASLDWLTQDSIVESVEIIVESVQFNQVIFKIELRRFSGETEIYESYWDSTKQKFEFRG